MSLLNRILRVPAAPFSRRRRTGSPAERRGWVHVGGALLYVGPSSRLSIERASSRERKNAEDLAEALLQPAPEHRALDRVETVVSDAEDVTEGVERAQELVDLLRRGADPKEVASELDALLALVGERHRAGRLADVVRLAQVLVAGLLLALRWRDLVTVTRIAADAADELGDAVEKAWALQELGTLAAAAEVPQLATGLLSEAGELFQQAGEHAGVDLVSQALTFLESAPGAIAKAAGWVTTHKLAAAASVVVVAGGGALIATRDEPRHASDPVLLAGGLSPTSEAAVATDRDGVVHVIWLADVPDSAAYVVVTRRRAPGGTWSSEQRLSKARHSAGALQLVRRPTGEVCGMWDGYVEVWPIGFGSSRLWERCFVGGAWTPRREVGSPSQVGGDIRSPMLGAYSPDGTLRTILSNLGAVSYAGRLLSGEGNVYQVAFVADSDGRLHVIWLEFGRRVVHRSSSDGGRTWTPMRPVGVSFGSAIDVAADSSGQVHLVTSSGDDVYHTRWTEAGGWERETEVSGELEGAIYAAVAAGVDGRATVAWPVTEGLGLAVQRGDGFFREAEVVRDRLLGEGGTVDVAAGEDGLSEIVVVSSEGDLVHLERAS